MNYIILSLVVILLSIIYEQHRNDKILSMILMFAICAILCVFAGLRNNYNDTPAYIARFSSSNTGSFSYVLGDGGFKISNVYLFKLLNWFIYNFITKDVHIYLGICAAIFVIPTVNLIRKYSQNFTFSMLIFMMVELYLFSLAGLKQALAIGVMTLGINAYINKKLWKYYLYCIAAIGFHTYAIIYLFLPLFGIKVWNKRTKIMCIAVLVFGVYLSRVTGVVLNIIEFLGKDIEKDALISGNINIYRVFAYSAPFILSVVSSRNLKIETNRAQLIATKMGILSGLFIVLAIFGNPILFGRIPNYFMIGTAICIPYLIQSGFSNENRSLVNLMAVVCYGFFGIYSIYSEGGFQQDIFQLMWFS